MPAPQSVVQAVQAAIVASAHLAAYEHVSVAAAACQRLGQLTSGRWRSAGRDLGMLEEDLQTAFAAAAESVTERAEELGLPEETLWTVGDAAGTLDLLRGAAIDEVEESSRPSRILTGEVLYGVSFVEDPDLPDRGTTLLFGWPEPLSPATWSWQANWVAGGAQDNGQQDGDDDELDLFEAGEMEGDEPLVAELADELQCSRQDARGALRDAALALTRASLLASTGGGEGEEEEEDDADDSS
jgi:hypothetical protein